MYKNNVCVNVKEFWEGFDGGTTNPPHTEQSSTHDCEQSQLTHARQKILN